MDLGLPAQFTRRLNMLDQALIDYQAAYKEDKHERLARFFIISCEMMNSLDIQKLGEDMQKVLERPLDESTPRIWEDEGFEYFLDLENRILEEVGVEKSARSRIAEYIANLRLYHEPIVPPHPSRPGSHPTAFRTVAVEEVIENIAELKTEVCRFSRVALSRLHFADADWRMKESRMSWRAKVANIAFSTFGVGVTVINTGAGLLGFMAADTASYSIGAGATLLTFRK
jgi:hypothetical protein